MRKLHRNLQSMAGRYLLALLFTGCATTTVTPTFRATGGLPQPDRVVVFDFAVTPEEAGVDRAVRTAPEPQEDIRIGKAIAQALSANLVQELRNRGIGAYLARETSPPGETSASIRGRFLRTSGAQGATSASIGFVPGAQVSTRVQVFQGAGLKVSLVGEADTTTPSGLKPGAVSGAAIEADAKLMAQAIAERVVNYYRQAGWIK